MKPSPEKVNAFPELQPGDILLYGGGFIGALIQFRTWSDVSHVEVYVGNGRSVASRAEGVGIYALRVMGLRRVMRTKKLDHLEAGIRWFRTVEGTRYGYFDLLQFYLLRLPTRGMICSQFADLFFRHCGLPLFSLSYNAGAICPRDYETISPILAEQIWAT